VNFGPGRRGEGGPLDEGSPRDRSFANAIIQGLRQSAEDRPRLPCYTSPDRRQLRPCLTEACAPSDHHSEWFEKVAPPALRLKGNPAARWSFAKRKSNQIPRLSASS